MWLYLNQCISEQPAKLTCVPCSVIHLSILNHPRIPKVPLREHSAMEQQVLNGLISDMQMERERNMSMLIEQWEQEREHFL